MIANLVGELLGLGLVGAAGFGAIVVFGEPGSALHVMALALLVIGVGAIEGAIVGFAQAVVLRRRLARLRSWVAATVAGAAAAWTLGMLPSTMMSLAEAAPPAPAATSDLLQLVLAVPLGLVAGAILGLPQWWVLRRYVSRAGWWIAANALAWGAGMPLVFVAAGVRPAAGAAATVLLVIGSLAAAGSVVGAIHGAFLVRLTARGAQ